MRYGSSQLDDQVEPPLAFQHLRNGLALEGGLHEVGDVLAAHAVEGQVVGPQDDVQLVDSLPAAR